MTLQKNCSDSKKWSKTLKRIENYNWLFEMKFHVEWL